MGHDLLWRAQTGASCIPSIPKAQRGNYKLRGAGEAAGIVISEKLHLELRSFASGLSGRPRPTHLDLRRVFAIPDEQTEDERLALLPSRVQHSPSPLIFTLRNHWVPKGVMLSHRNLRAWFPCFLPFLTCHQDGVLSVLPLHHTSSSPRVFSYSTEPRSADNI